MGTKQDPGKFDCYKNAEPDEPMFILLARDPLAPILVEMWAQFRALNDGEISDKTSEARTCAMRMRRWKMDRVKLVRHGSDAADTDAGDQVKAVPHRDGCEQPRGKQVDVFQAQDIEDVRLVDGGLIHVDLNSWVLPRPVKFEVVLDVPHPNIRGRYKVEGVTPGGFVASKTSALWP